VFQLTLPAQSIFGKPENGKMPLESYVRLLGSNNVSVTSVVTEMRFDTASATPKLTFKALRYLEEDEFINVQEKGQSNEAKTAIGLTPADVDSLGLPPPPAHVTKEAPKAAPKPAVKKVAPVVEEETDDEPQEEPVKRVKKAEVETPKDVNDILDDWA
jgi:type IV secretory pathway VirB10-like protein